MLYQQNDQADPVIRAEALATLAHHGVRNPKNGEPYIEHPRRVVGYLPTVVAALGDEWGVPDTYDAHDTLDAIAWLHDTIEDTWVTTGILSQTGFSAEVIEGVTRLTVGFSPATKIRKAYYEHLREHWASRIVKVADLLDNTDPTRLALLPEEDQQRLLKKYHFAAQVLGCEDFFIAYNAERRSGEPS